VQRASLKPSYLEIPVRVALTPFFSTVGWELANLISGCSWFSIRFELADYRPDVVAVDVDSGYYLAGSFLLLLSTLTVIGTLFSDISCVGRPPHPFELYRRGHAMTTAYDPNQVYVDEEEKKVEERVPLHRHCRGCGEVPQTKSGVDQCDMGYHHLFCGDFLVIRWLPIPRMILYKIQTGIANSNPYSVCPRAILECRLCNKIVQCAGP
jgi:hypothetical protein